jgi:hypothetical protein
MSDLGPLCSPRADMEADQDRSSRAPRSIRRASPRLPKSAGAEGLGGDSPSRHRPRVAGLEAEAISLALRTNLKVPITKAKVHQYNHGDLAPAVRVVVDAALTD